VPLGLGEGVAALGLGAGLDRGRQGPLGVAGGVPVVGELGGHGGVGAPGPPGMGRDGRGHLAVEAGPLTRQQVGVGDLAEQCVAELVAVVARADDQQLGGDRLPEGLVEPPPVEPGDGGQQPVRRPPADHGGHPEGLPGRLGDPLDPASQQLGGGGRQHAGRFAGPGPGRIVASTAFVASDEVRQMQQRSVPQVGSTARMIVLSLLVAVVLAMALLATAARPAPAPKPPMQFGPSAGPARPM
jgi:hypothetical protein